MVGGGTGDWLSYANATGGGDGESGHGHRHRGEAAGDTFSGFQHLIGSAEATR